MYSVTDRYQHYRETHCLHLQGRRASKSATPRKQ